MKPLNKQKTERRNDFLKWWNKNHHRTKAHTWLSHYCRKMVFMYAMPPESFSHVQTVTKRFFSSDHKKLKQVDAWTLWRISHPLHFERVARLKTHAAFLEIQNEQFKTNRKENK